MNKKTRIVIGIAILALANIFCGQTPAGGPTPTVTAGNSETETSTPPHPTPTETPVPPTPTDTPAPTETPVPPTPTEASDLLSVQFEDDTDDAVDCNTQAAAVDPEVDIQSLTVHYNPATGTMIAEVKMDMPLVNHFSFAVAYFVLTTQGNATGYLWEVHDQVYRLGQMDPQTFQVIPEPNQVTITTTLTTTDGLTISHDQDAGVVTFNIPQTRLLEENAYVAARSFHTGIEGQPVNCDQIGSFPLPETMWHLP